MGVRGKSETIGCRDYRVQVITEVLVLSLAVLAFIPAARSYNTGDHSK